jgi:hypothetical protein
MLKIAGHRWRLKLGILLFLAGQLFSAAHALEFGPTPHEHDGVLCLAIHSFELDDLVPAADPTAPAFGPSVALILETASPAGLLRPRGLLPPATGPPSL